MAELKNFNVLSGVKLSPNKFAGTCLATGDPVPAGNGFVFRDSTGWATLSRLAVDELGRAEILIVSEDEEDEANRAEAEEGKRLARELAGKDRGGHMMQSHRLERYVFVGDEFDRLAKQLPGGIDLSRWTAELRRRSFLRSDMVRKSMADA